MVQPKFKYLGGKQIEYSIEGKQHISSFYQKKKKDIIFSQDKYHKMKEDRFIV